ncbi:YqhR family membrane protein [Halalkalibacter sp. APA_J-10(15)]|uniref:YqhR family membrane protein n=1 Tax=Halalkalibacter sp. APA_J-10(15) TaxID=2933805 RepID=UPI001FF4A113|nr:YqhR family membrane protein [Halalkalibacter sp. APA_J-10(15)]MCK0472568.1 YqhR family membrane protein [Halalkalibacter sp. APA_J-10(15)]
MEKQTMEQQMSFAAKVAVIGFFGGLIWSLVGYFAFYFKFIRVGPALALMPFVLGEWKDTYIGQLVGIGLISVLSIGIAFLYKLLLQKVNSMWAGVVYGLVLWVSVFFLLNPIFPGLKSVQNLDFNTIITSVCLYVLYGTFIGYSISFQYAEERQK